jgi:hypothetical protein
MFYWRIRYGCLSLLLSLLVVAGVCANRVRANSARALLPDDTLGFVWIRNVDEADAKISTFLQRFGVPLPPPLKFLKFATGLGEGIDGGSDLLVALLPPKAGARGYQPVVLLPVEDYGKLAASVRGDASGEICRITMSGEDVLIARNRSHAILMNVEHRATMVRLLAREPQIPEAVRPLNQWLEENDMAVVVSPTGMKDLFALGREGLDRSQQQFEQNIEEIPMEELVAQVRQTLEIYRVMLDVTDAQVESSALGVSIDPRANVKVGARLILAKTSEFSQFRFTPLDPRQRMSGQALLLGLSHQKLPPGQSPHRATAGEEKLDEVIEGTGQAEAYVATLAGTIPRGWGELVAKMSRRLHQRFPDLEGYGNFEQADWDKVEQSYRATSAGVQAISFVMRSSKDDEPLLSGFYGVVQVEDASAYLASYQQALEMNNELVERSDSDIRLKNEFSPVTVADAVGIKVEVDIAGPSGDQNNPFWQATLGNLLGEEGKFKMHLLAVDKTHVVLSTATEENLIRFVHDFRADDWQDQSARIGGSSLHMTLQLIEEDSPWIMAVSPRGLVRWLTRWMKAFMGQLGESPQIPPFPVTPPIGFSFSLVKGYCEVDMVLPAETINGMAEFIQAAQEQ